MLVLCFIAAAYCTCKNFKFHCKFYCSCDPPFTGQSGHDDDDVENDNYDDSDVGVDYLDVKFIGRRQDVTTQVDDPETFVLVKELSMYSDPLPGPHVTSSSHVLTHHEVVREPPSVADYTKLPHLRITVATVIRNSQPIIVTHCFS